jgi:hypothetical protein
VQRADARDMLGWIIPGLRGGKGVSAPNLHRRSLSPPIIFPPVSSISERDSPARNRTDGTQLLTQLEYSRSLETEVIEGRDLDRFLINLKWIDGETGHGESRLAN